MRSRFYAFQRNHHRISSLLSYGCLITKSYIFVFALTTYMIKPIYVQGSSMYPTLQEGAIGISNIFVTSFREIERFDVVIVKSPTKQKEEWIKRVIALPKETIQYKHDVLYINGLAVQEPYLDSQYMNHKKIQYDTPCFTEDFGPMVLGEDEYFMMGDNRHISNDSRQVGTFHKEQILASDTFILLH